MRASTLLLAAAFASIQFVAGQDTIEIDTPTSEEDWTKFLLNEAEFEGEAGNLTKRTFFGKFCKTFPGDLLWPSNLGWNVLKAAVGERLTKTIPAAAPCYNSFQSQSTYNAGQCASVQTSWYSQDWHSESPHSIHWPLWTNSSCIPTTDPSGSCTIGKYPHYVVKAQSVRDVQMAVNWARNLNIRLLVKNTGHDFMGKSIGAGSLSIWTRGFTDIQFIDSYNEAGSGYSGPAVKLGSGWTSRNLYTALRAKGKVVVGGECATVGFSGGYIQGGGHGPLTSQFGMAADNVLAFDIVTANGAFQTVSKTRNPNLFWALRGGGAASWGVVTAVTVKTYDDFITSGSSIVVDANQDSDKIWEAVSILHEEAQGWAPLHGIYVYYEIGFLGYNSFVIKPILAPKKTVSQLNSILAPFFQKLDGAGIQYTQTTQQFSSFLEAYQGLFEGEPAGLYMFTSSRGFKRSHFNTSNDDIVAAIRANHEMGRIFVGHIENPGLVGGASDETSINPLFKDIFLLLLYNAILTGNETPSQLQAVFDETNNVVDARFKALSPGAGTYLNEANVMDPNWQEEFYGANWARLAQIKEQVDYRGVFYAEGAVGAQNWKKVAGDRLCPV